MTTRWARFARGWLAAVFSTTVAAASHTLAGGNSPSAVSLVVALAFAGVACIALTGTTLSLTRLTASVALSQLAFHVLFSTIGTSAGAPARFAGSAHDHSSTLTSSTLTLGAESGAGAVAHHADGWMWLGHAAGAVLTIVALRYGEGAFWRLTAIALLFVRTLFARIPVVPLVPRPVRRARVVGHLFMPRICAVLRSTLGLRGPPAPSFS
jgi:hypothetical protein